MGRRRGLLGRGRACVACRASDEGSVVVPGHGSHVIFGGILVIITLYWPVSVVFVAEKEWKGALVVIVFTSAVQKPQSAAGLRGWQWLAVLEVSAMVEGWIINFCSNSNVVLH